MKTYGGVEVYFHIFLTSTLDGSDNFRHQRLQSQGMNPGTYWIGGCVDPRDGMGPMEKRKRSIPAGN
jgi:hypothetical protein